MKKIIALSLSVLLCTAVFAGGTDNTSGASGVAVIRKDASTVKLIYRAIKAGDVRISILDSNNKVVFRESIKTEEGFIRPYNLASLAEGEYSMEIVDHAGKQIEKIHNYTKKKTERIFNVRKIQDGRKLLLTVSGEGEQKINVKIYDGMNTLVYDADQSVSGDFAQVYDVKGVKGSITFEVTGENGQSKITYY